MKLCRYSQSFQDLSGAVDIDPTPLVGGAIVRQGILHRMGKKVAVKAGRFTNDPRSDEVCFLIADATYICYVDLISSSFARFTLFLNFDTTISSDCWVISLKTPV